MSINVREDMRGAESLVGGGEMGKVVRSMDWTETPLGPIDSWPQSLRTTVSLCLASNFPISLAWGPKHVQLYNDGYWPICGKKHPHSMGQDFSECWASAWPVIGEAFERALLGETCFLENQRMFLDRNGYLEETFFTFSFSPILDESGGVGGLFHPATETTAQMLGERRARVLRDLGTQNGKATTTEEAFALAAQTLAECELDIPFAMFYLLDVERNEARLIARSGTLPDILAIPTVELKNPRSSIWPLAEVESANQTLRVDDLKTGSVSCGPYPEGPKTAFVLPITPPGCERPTAILVAGVSSRLPLNAAYRYFYDLVVTAVTSSVANARAGEEQRKRTEALAEIDRAKTAFFSNVSHEFRTPLTLMLGPLEDELGELTNPLPAVRRERLDMAHRNALRLLKLVNTLLDFSSIEAGRVDASYEATDLSIWTAELASAFRSAVEKGGLSFKIDCPPMPELVYIDREMWEKVVLNLLSNAFKHTFIGGIHVSLKWCGDYVELSVMDSGVGIPDAELPGLFDRFRRVKGAKSRSHEGTGIGLALVQELVRLHGGTVRVESQEGKGSTFTVTVKTGQAHLPADRLGKQRSQTLSATRAVAFVGEAQYWASDISAASIPSLLPVEPTDNLHLLEGAEEPSAERSRILWADDNADMRDYVGRLLGTRYDVTAVSDGTTALATALATTPDLILTDIMMPGLDGFALLRELRINERTRTIPVILLSARAGEESAVEGLEVGADDYLIKPFSARELLARVESHLKMGKLRRAWAAELERRVQELAEANGDLQEQIQERARVEDAFQQIMDNSLDVICTFDAEGRFLQVNRACEVLWGYRAEELKGLPYHDMIHPDDRERSLAAAATVMGGRPEKDLENRYLRRDGSVVPLLWTATWSQTHQIMFCVARDMTARKQIESELLGAKEVAEATNRAKSEFLANMSHEIRTPMNGIIGMTELLLEGDLDSQPRDFAETIRASADSLLKIINDILDFSKMEAGKLSFELLDFDLIETIESMLDLLAESAYAKGIELVSEVAPDLPTQLRGDPGRLRQILTNLVGNAIKFTEKGEVVVRISKENETDTHARLNFRVEDSGIGISSEAQGKLFEAFSQADASTTRKYGGTGLGLVIAKQLTAMMDGKMGVQSEPGKGSTFWFSAELEKQSGTARNRHPFPHNLAGVHVLAVDDNATNRRILRLQLEAWKMLVGIASCGDEALRMMRDAASRGKPYGLAILDVQMPKMDGWMLAEAIQAETALAGTRLIILTSFGQAFSPAELKAAGIEAYLVKPVKHSRLFECVTNAVGKAVAADIPFELTVPCGAEISSKFGMLPSAEKRVLLAEDNRVNQKVALARLQKLGYRAEAVMSGLQVLEALKSLPYDLILMDCQMPEMDGYQATRAIRDWEQSLERPCPWHAPIYIIAVTAHAMDGDREKCLAAGMNDYLSKPMLLPELQAALERWQLGFQLST